MKKDILFESNLFRWLGQLNLVRERKDRVQSIRERRYIVDVNGSKTNNPFDCLRKSKANVNHVEISLNPEPIQSI